MRLPLRIAVLECDTPLDGTRAKYGGYGGVFTKLLKAGADYLGKPGLSSTDGLEISKWHVEKESVFPDLKDIDAILLTGSRYNAFDNTPWIEALVNFTAKVLEQDRVRIIGVCFGHQILARALKAKVGRSDAGWEVSVCKVDLSPVGEQIFGQDELYIHQMHRDIVTEMPSLPNSHDKIEVLGKSPKCEFQGFYCRNRFISVQGHPEFNAEIVEEILETRNKGGIIDDPTFNDAMHRVKNKQDGVLIASRFLDFLLEQ